MVIINLYRYDQEPKIFAPGLRF